MNKQATKQCAACGRPVKNPLTWNGKEYGIECWKKIAIPEIEAQREARKQARFDAHARQCHIAIEVLKHKDMSKIKNEWRRNFIASVIAQYEEKGFLSGRQLELIRKQYNAADHCFEIEMRYGMGDLVEKDYHEQMALWCRTEKERTYHYAKVDLLRLGDNYANKEKLLRIVAEYEKANQFENP
jgi:hypothetical protein